MSFKIISGWAQIRMIICFLYSSIRIIRKENIDQIYSSGPPFILHKIGLLLKYLFPKIHWIADFRDPWLYSEKSYKNELSSIEKIFFDNTIKKADSIITVTAEHELFLKSHSVLYGDKTTCIPNGVKRSEIIEYKSNHKKYFPGISIGYLGDLDYAHRDPTFLLKAYKLFKTINKKNTSMHFWTKYNPNVKWKNKNLKELISEQKIGESITIHSIVSQAEARVIQAKLDILIIFAFGQPHQIPAKAYDYLLSGTVIMALCEKESSTWNFLKNFDGIFGCHINESDQICSIIKKSVDLAEEMNGNKYNRPSDNIDNTRHISHFLKTIMKK